MNMKESVALFNKIAGKLNENILLADSNFMWEDIQNSAARVLEEAKELEEAANNKDLTEVLDGVVDVLYTIYHTQELLEMLGVDVEGACKEICENNLSKFPKDMPVALDTVKHYEDEGVAVQAGQYEDSYIIKRNPDNKVMKPVGYISPDITQYIPKSAYEFLGES